MRRINLSPPEQAALESTFKTTTDRRLRDRSVGSGRVLGASNKPDRGEKWLGRDEMGGTS